MTETTCVRCGRPMADQAYADSACAYRAGDQLHAIADMVPAARDVAHGFARRGPTGNGGSEARLPLNLGATQRLDSVQNTLTTWARHVVETRGVALKGVGPDPIVHAAHYLAGNVEWVRHNPAAEEFLADVEACARVVAGIARGPASQRYLGPCGAPTWCDVTGIGKEPGSELVEGAPCDGDVYCREGAQHGACRTCGAEVSTRERQAWLDGEVRARAFRASEIEDAFGIKANLIRQWATPARGLVDVHGQDREGRALYLLSHVLDVAAAQAAKRAEAQAKRARREATRAEGDAA